MPLQIKLAPAVVGSEVIGAQISANKEIRTVGVWSGLSLFVTEKLLLGLAQLAPKASQRTV